MINVLENVPYREEGLGKRKVLDENHLQIMQLALKPGQKVPPHDANSNVHLLVIKGEVIVNLQGVDNVVKEGTLLPVAYKTPMKIRNDSDDDAAFLVLKSPNPSEMK